MFDSEEQFFNAVKVYAKENGFSVRKGNVEKLNGLIVSREIVCSREGERKKVKTQGKTPFLKSFSSIPHNI